MMMMVIIIIITTLKVKHCNTLTRKLTLNLKDNLSWKNLHYFQSNLITTKAASSQCVRLPRAVCQQQ